MDLIRNLYQRLRQFNATRNQVIADRLISESGRLESSFRAEAKKLGIDISSQRVANYYDVLGLRFTNDQKIIKAAYVSKIKKHHPDVSREADAKEMTAEVNAAYATLKDRKLKADYDDKFAKGKNRIDPDTAKNLSNMLVLRYSERRNAEFDSFRNRVSVPLPRDEIRSAIDGLANWKATLDDSAEDIFGRFWASGRKLRKLQRSNTAMMKKNLDAERLHGIKLNGYRLDGLVKAYEELSPGISVIIKDVERIIERDENRILGRLRASAQ